MFDKLKNSSVMIFANQVATDANQLKNLFPMVDAPKAGESRLEWMLSTAFTVEIC